VFLLLISCSHQQDTGQVHPQYFSLTEFFNQEIARLDSQSLYLYRTVRIGSKVSETIDSTPEWKEEFSLFQDCDINKPELVSDYSVDSVIQGNERHYLYENISATNRVSNIHVYWKNNSLPELIEITVKEKNYFKDEEFVYSYQPSLAIGVMGTRKNLTSEENEFEILSEIRKK